VFKGGTHVIPLTVTVLDANGRPVKDLKASDFTVIENKKVREIVISSRRSFSPSSCRPRPSRPAANRVRDDLVQPQTRRTLPHRCSATAALKSRRTRSKAPPISSATGCCRRTRWRSWAFTASRTSPSITKPSRKLLDRYRQEHEKLCFDIDEYLVMSRGGPGQGYGGAAIPVKFLRRADEIFLGPTATVDRRQRFL
jgi:hypothetical protein